MNFKRSIWNTKQGVTALPLDPPPFFLEKEIRLSFKGLGMYSTGVGLIVLFGLWWFFFPGGRYPLPSLTSLIIVSAVSSGLYHGIRLVSYWVVWAWVIRKYPSIGGIHPAARGELPRNGFLLVLLCPSLGLVVLCAVLYGVYDGFGPELWLCTAIGAASSITDLRVVRQLVFVDESCWLKQTEYGMDVLKPIGSG